MKDLSAKDLTQQSQEEALRELPPSILKTLGINAFAQLERQLKAATDMDGNVGSIDLDSIRPNTARIFIDEVLKDPKKLRWFIFLIWIGTVAFFLAILVDKLVPQLVAFLTASGAYLVAGWSQLSPWISRVVGRIHDWDLKVQIAYEYYRNAQVRYHEVATSGDAQAGDVPVVDDLHMLRRQVADDLGLRRVIRPVTLQAASYIFVAHALDRIWSGSIIISKLLFCK